MQPMGSYAQLLMDDEVSQREKDQLVKMGMWSDGICLEAHG